MDFTGHYTSHTSASRVRDLTTSGGKGSLRVQITKGLAGHIGYATSFDHVESVASGRNRSVTFGLDFDHPLSLTRKTTMTFGTGLAGVTYVTGTHYHLIGNVQLMRELGRSWGTGLGYVRNVSFMETFAAPVIYDALTGELGGLISRRLRLSASVSGARGQAGQTGGATPSNRFKTAHETVALSYALSGNMAASLDYSHFNYLYDGGILLQPGIPRDMNRQSVRGTLTMSTSIFRHR